MPAWHTNENWGEVAKLILSALSLQLAALETAMEIDDLDLPGYRLHPLKGEREGLWSITVNGNWRLTFEFSAAGDVHILNYEDYH